MILILSSRVSSRVSVSISIAAKLPHRRRTASQCGPCEQHVEYFCCCIMTCNLNYSCEAILHVVLWSVSDIMNVVRDKLCR